MLRCRSFLAKDFQLVKKKEIFLPSKYYTPGEHFRQLTKYSRQFLNSYIFWYKKILRKLFHYFFIFGRYSAITTARGTQTKVIIQE